MLMWRLLKRIAPKTLSGRAVMIVVLPTLLVQALSTYMFYERHWANVHKHMAIALASEVAYIVKRAEVPANRKHSLTLAENYFGMRAHWEAEPSNENIATAAIPYPELHRQLWERLPYPFRVIDNVQDRVDIRVLMPDGVLTLHTSEKRFWSATTYIFMLWMNGSALFFLIIALLFLRNQIRPIEQLADAAEAFGKGQPILNFRPRGAKEVRRAGQAFIMMSERIRRWSSQRTQFLAAISHDLRTPLTRMKLQLAIAPSAVLEPLAQDIAEMEAMIGAYLAFVRGEGSEAAVETPLRSLLEEVVARYAHHGTSIILHPVPDILLPLKVQSFRRCLQNILDNGLRFASHIEIRVQQHEQQVDIIIDDNGSGIPEELRDEMFQPFRKGEAARTPGDGGVGLGLSIAKDIVLAHGGTIALQDSPLGGLRVRISL
jgi:two-component system osmolarity sensor histidine kinase EnvZ